MKNDDRHIALRTYRSLRGGMVVMVVMLGVALLIERSTATCWQASISAYFFTTAHSVFVAALCVLGGLFIMYEGSSDTEDVLLNLAGVLAFVVAMVPTTRPDVMCGRYVVPTYEVTHMITDNVWSVVIALFAVQALYWGMRKKNDSSRNVSTLGIVGLCVFWAVMVAGLITLIWFREQFDSKAHGVAAVTMFLAIIANVVITAFLVGRQEEANSPHRRQYYFLYRCVALLMLVTLVAVIVAHFALAPGNHSVIWGEAALIGFFAAYWAIQTIELWKTPDRKEKLSERDRALLAEGRTRGRPEAAAPEQRPAPKRPRGERVLRAL
jgi:hypothetical protein